VERQSVNVFALITDSYIAIAEWVRDLFNPIDQIVPASALPGDFILYPMVRPLGLFIRMGQYLNGDSFADFEHAAVYIGDGQMVEAMPGGARISRVSRYGNVKVLWSTGSFDLTDEQRAKIVANAKDIAARRVGYSFLMYLAFALHMMHLPIPLLKWYIGNTHHLICSQLVALCYYSAEHPIGDITKRWSGYITPGDLYQAIKKLGTWFPGKK
jgi:hypothetical protein